MRFVLTFLLLLSASHSMAAPVGFSGSIGPYQIELELDRSEDRLIGQYRYAGQDEWIDLDGSAYGKYAFYLEETVAKRVTGEFYLAQVGQRLEGHWVDDDTDLEVVLNPTTGVVEDLLDIPAPPQVGDGLTGRYADTQYFINDWFAPHYEIGSNGGEVSVVELDPSTILVGFEFTVGPTYHLAIFFGQASLAEDGSYVHDAVLPGGDTNCRLVFRFEAKQLSIEDIGNGYACQFGARAHANFDLPKVSDTATFGSAR